MSSSNRAVHKHRRDNRTGDNAVKVWYRRHAKEYGWFLLLVLPNVAVIAMFIYRPLILNFYYSTLNWKLGSSVATVVGLGNYKDWFTSPESLKIIIVTVVFTVCVVGGSLLLGLLLAIALNQKLPGTGFARSVIFAPYVLPGVGIAMVWLFIFDPTYGALQGILSAVNIESPNWFLGPKAALAMIIIVFLWKMLGYAALVYLAGLQVVPQDVYEAAEIDGVVGVRRFLKVVFPLLSPTTFFLLITVTLDSMRLSFDVIRIMTKGGPDEHTETLVYQVYQEAFVNGDAGYASTAAVILFIILMGVTILQMRFIERRVHYS
jgi:sn-glycerol 3-phosphate transport system permease protein